MRGRSSSEVMMNFRRASALVLATLAGCSDADDPRPSLLLSTSAADVAGYTQVQIEIVADNAPAFTNVYQATDLSSAKTLRIVKEGSPGADPPAGSLNPGTVPVNGSNLQITIRATGSKDPIIRSAKVSLPDKAGRLLQMPLLAECAGVACKIGQTCDKGANCVSDEVSVGGLSATDDE